MEILSVFSPEFRAYGRVVEGYPVQGLLDALAQTPLTEGVVYVPREPMLHRDSEFNLGTEDFILLLGLQGDIVDGRLDTATVKAFRCPAGVLIEVYATSLHYAPCHTDPARGFRVMVALPENTNTDYRPEGGANVMDRMLWARNKWLLAHAESDEAAQGAVVALDGVNIDIAAEL